MNELAENKAASWLIKGLGGCAALLDEIVRSNYQLSGSQLANLVNYLNQLVELKRIAQEKRAK